MKIAKAFHKLARRTLLLTAGLIVFTTSLLSQTKPAGSCPTDNMNNRQGKNLFQDAGASCPPDDYCAPFAVLRGSVFEESGNPAAGALVRIERKAATGIFTVRTDKYGRYSYTGLPTGEYLVCIEYRGAFGLSRETPLQNGRTGLSDFDLKFF
jgi:hypothetical protein